MALQGADHVSPGDVMRRISNLERQIRMMQTARRLEAASIGSGGLTVKDGFVRWLDADGNETARFATDELTLEGLLTVVGKIQVGGDDGKIEVVDGEGNVALTLSTQHLQLAGLLQMLAGANIETYDEADDLRLAIGNVVLAYDADGTVRVNLGELFGGSIGLLVNNAGGGAMAAFSEQERSLWDGTGSRAVQVGDEGLSRPMLPMGWSIPGVAGETSAGTFTAVCECLTYRSHPTVRVDAQVAIDAGVTADVELWDSFSSTQLDVETGLTGSNAIALEGSVPGTAWSSRFLQLRARVTAGTGAVRVRPYGGWTGNV